MRAPASPHDPAEPGPGRISATDTIAPANKGERVPNTGRAHKRGFIRSASRLHRHVDLAGRRRRRTDPRHHPDRGEDKCVVPPHAPAAGKVSPRRIVDRTY